MFFPDMENGASTGEIMFDDFEYNVDLPAQLPMESDGNFFIQPLPEAWKEILAEEIPIVLDILENSHTYLAGGFLRQLIASEPLDPNTTDIDLFFGFPVTYEIVKAHLGDMDGFEVIFRCPENKLVTFKDKVTGWKYQCIAMDFYPTLFDVVNSFDFTTTCFGTDGTRLIFHKEAITDTLDKNLRWNKITYPASSMRRMMKYARKGFTMSESEYQYFVECIAHNSPDIVDHQLVYVD